MKRFLTALLAVALLLGLAACAGEVKEIRKTAAEEKSAPAVTVGKEGSVDGYVFRAGDFSIAVDADMAPVLAALGEARSYYESVSCAFNGLDKLYTYDHFQVTSYPAPDGDRVQTVWLMDDTVATPEGLRVGAPASQVDALYGSSFEAVGAERIYSKGGMKLKVIVQEDKVTSITYQSVIADEND